MLSTSLIISWPLLVTSIAFWFNKKQNGKKPWTGGPISWPKCFWLAYTTTTWFILPVIFLIHPSFPTALRSFFIFHLISWWIRGPLELVMIYKWFNWTPKYGISHDIFHIIGCSFLLFSARHDLLKLQVLPAAVYPAQFIYQLPSDFALLSAIFAISIILTTCAEIAFASLFFKVRSHEEKESNIYFASDDPKWIFINRLTLSVVVVAMTHLTLQSVWLVLML